VSEEEITHSQRHTIFIAGYLAGQSEPNSVDQAIADMWNACDHDDGVEIRANHDQWWGVYAKCGHLTARGVSDGILDLSTAFDRCRIDFLGQHKELPITKGET